MNCITYVHNALKIILLSHVSFVLSMYFPEDKLQELKKQLKEQQRIHKQKQYDAIAHNGKVTKDSSLLFKTYQGCNGSVIDYILMRDLITLGVLYRDAKALEETGLSLPFSLIDNFE